MNFVSQVLGVPLGYVMYVCYTIAHSYGWAIVLFALVSKLIFFPLSVSSQKNSIRLLKLQPAIEDIHQRYSGDKNQINEELYELYKREKYSPLKGSIPLLVQLPLILGMINVMYNPLQHILHLSKDVIQSLAGATATLLSISSESFGIQLRIIDAAQAPSNQVFYRDLIVSMPGMQSALDQISQIDLTFLGLNLGLTPTLATPNILLIIPLLSGISALVLCLVQNALNPAAKQQSAVGQWVMTILLVAFSVYFTFAVPSGVGVYWICSNLFSLVVALLLNVIYNPAKEADVAGKTQKIKLTREEKKGARQYAATLKKRENEAYNRFFSQKDKQLVIYSGTSGSYKYFQTFIEYLLANSEVIIHYVSNDPNDAIFQKNEALIQTYYVGRNKLISLMVKMDADIVLMTTPDLQKYHIKRSVVRKDVEYIYTFHAISSSNMVLREGALDHYDTIFCEGPHKIEEIRRTEEIYGLPKKRLVKVGYSLMDLLFHAYKEMSPREDTSKPQILVAPSWQIDNILDCCIDQVIEQLVDKGYRLIIRPHPEYIKRFPQRMKDIIERHIDKVNDDFFFELDFSSNDTIYQSDLLITDWSNIAFEFSFCTKLPTISINTTMKVMNPEYKRIDIEPINITLRNVIGVGVDLERLSDLGSIVATTLANKDTYKETIESIMGDYLYHPGRSGEAGGKYILQRLVKYAEMRNLDNGVLS